MDGLMMDFQLTLPPILRRAETYFGGHEIVTRLPDKTFHRYRYADFGRRSRALAAALQKLGLERGDRVATLCWNHYQHLEAYFGIPCGGFVLHTLNLRLHPNDIGYIANHGGDKAVIVDRSLLPLLEQFQDETQIKHVFVVEDSYEELLGSVDPDDYRDPELRRERGRGDVLHERHDRAAEGRRLLAPLDGSAHARRRRRESDRSRASRDQDAILPVVPMFHANAWGYPYLAAMLGAKLVFPGPHLDPESLLDDFVEEGVTWTAGVPTIWMGILADARQANRTAGICRKLKGMLVGGSAAPRAMIAGFKQRHGLTIVHGWGMTETSPVATVAMLPGDLHHADEETQFDYISLQGLPLPFVELRACDDEGKEIPWDDESMGELEVRGPWVSSLVLRVAGQGRPLDGGRLVQDGRHRVDASARLREHPGSLEGRDQVRRRVDQLGRARERVDGTPGGGRGRRDRDPGREVAGAPTGRGRAAGGRDGDGGRPARVPGAELRQVVAPGSLRVRRRDPEDRRRQVPEDRASRPVRGGAGRQR